VTADQIHELEAFRYQCLTRAADLVEMAPRSISKSIGWRMLMWSLLHYTDYLGRIIAKHEGTQ